MLIEIKRCSTIPALPKEIIWPRCLAPLSYFLTEVGGRRHAKLETSIPKPIEKEQMLNQYDAEQFVIMSTTESILRNNYARK